MKKRMNETKIPDEFTGLDLNPESDSEYDKCRRWRGGGEYNKQQDDCLTEVIGISD